MASVETPVISRGNIVEKDWIEDPEGTLMKIVYGERPEYKGEVKEKSIVFGKEKAQVLLNETVRESIKEFAE